MLFLVINNIDLIAPPGVQHNSGVYSSLIYVAILIYSLYDNRLNLIWCGFFGSTAMISYIGLIEWVNYLNDTNINLFMAAWDLLIGIALYYESKLFVD
jgi:hypothetical protein